MNVTRAAAALIAVWLSLAATAGAAPAAGTTLTLALDRPGAAISPTLFGLMFEDINHSGDGGIYAELIRNRAFLDDGLVPLDWSTVVSGRASG